MNNPSIFLKKNETHKEKTPDNSSSESSNKISKNNIFKTIPKNSYKTQQTQSQFKNMREFRWRFFRIPSKTITKDYVEISFMDPNSKRKLFNKKKWIEKEIDPNLNKFVVDEYYCYSHNQPNQQNLPNNNG